MIINAFLSMAGAAFWFLVFAVACGAATFIESAYDTPTAWAMVYGTAWFGVIQLILGLNLIYNLKEYRFFTLKKLPICAFHLGFLFILVGAGITRYLGVEGLMHIRNGASVSEFGTAQSFVQLRAISDGMSYLKARPIYVSKLSGNDFKIDLDVNGKKASLKYEKFVPNAIYEWQENNATNAMPLLEIMFSNDKNARKIALSSGDKIDLGGIEFSFDKDQNQSKKQNYINISLENGKFYLSSDQNLSYMKMADMSNGTLENNAKYELNDTRLFTLRRADESLNFAFSKMLKGAKQELVSASHGQIGQNAFLSTLSFNDKSKQVAIFENAMPSMASIDGVNFELSLNPIKIELPFSIKLDKFELLRYAGSNSPMSYSSFVKIQDEKTGDYDYHIYMNHVLDHGGYRFFQSSYDQDEQGTILSVNRDPGKWPTYLGYALLGIGFFFNILNPHSRFSKLSKSIREQNQNPKQNKNEISKSPKSAPKILALFALIVAIFSPNTLKASDVAINSQHAKIASTLIIQSFDGRMKPFDTLSYELLNKLYRSTSIDGMSANEAILSMTLLPSKWRATPIIKISDDEIKRLLNIPQSQNYASFNDFFSLSNKGSDYKLLALSQEANRKPLSARTRLDKEIIKIDEKINILYMIFAGEFLRIIPAQNDPSNTWHSPTSALSTLSGDEQKQILILLQDYFSKATQAISDNNWQEANQALENLKAYQVKYGANIMPNQAHIKAELLFNELQIFSKLTGVYLLAGLALLAVVFIRLASKWRLNIIFKIVYGINILAFILHTAGLALRWYISGHAPWSDAYESLVYIAWALALSGILFSRRSAISLALSTILAGCVLFVAHLSWIDPQITNLMPVLRSYWLTIHVSVITASYGFLGLCSLLGIFTLLLFSLQNRYKENIQFSQNILEATRINEMAMILGLGLLTVGNFLGGVWANESWGRYWGWDSKETWALISILVYAAVLHMRFIKALNSQYAFAVASMFAYWSIIFTYFGVNFYLSGLHSYAAGDVVQIPTFVYISVIAMIALALLALRGKVYSKKL